MLVCERLDGLRAVNKLEHILTEPFRDYQMQPYTPDEMRRTQVALLVLTYHALASTRQPVTSADLLAACDKLAALDSTLKLKRFVGLLRSDSYFCRRMLLTGMCVLDTSESDLTAVRACDTRARAHARSRVDGRPLVPRGRARSETGAGEKGLADTLRFPLRVARPARPLPFPRSRLRASC
jgi:hypothetical protein